MKIAHLLGWYFPDSVGGTEVYVEGLCRRLRAAGHRVVVAAPDSRHVAPERYTHDDVPVFRYPISDTPTRDEAYHRVPVRGAGRLYRWLADERGRCCVEEHQPATRCSRAPMPSAGAARPALAEVRRR